MVPRVEYTVPLGYRKGHLAMSNAELALARERALQLEQEREVVHDLSNAVSDAARAFENCQTCWNRLVAPMKYSPPTRCRRRTAVKWISNVSLMLNGVS